MADPDPSLLLSVSEATSGVYRDAVDVAFEVLQRDLARARNKRQSAKPLGERLKRLKTLYRKLHRASVGRECVPSDRKVWTLEDNEKVLKHLAKTITDSRLAKSVYGDEYLLHGLWDAGRLRGVEGLCQAVERLHTADAASVRARAEELEWLLATWTPRQASAAASLVTSRRLAPARRRRRPAPKPVRPNGQWRIVTRWASGPRRGR